MNTQKGLIKYCQSRSIAVQAMSTFSHFRFVLPREEIINSDLLKVIAEKHGKSVVQIVLRWMLQQNIIMIPKTWNSIHLKENISIFDFELSDEEMSFVDSMDKGYFLNYNPFGQQQGFVKKYRNWDGFQEWNKHNGRSFFKMLSEHLKR